jgi:hypothetical protein
MTAPVDETTRDYSRGNGADRGESRRLGGVPAVLLALGALGAAALIASEFSTLFSVSVPGRAGRSVSGHHQHGYALVIAGLLTLWLLFSAAQGVRMAMLGLACVGLLALGIAVIADLPDVHSTGVLGRLFESAQAQPGAGFYEETLGAALLLISGGGLLLLEPGAAAASGSAGATASSESGAAAAAGSESDGGAASAAGDGDYQR